MKNKNNKKFLSTYIKLFKLADFLKNKIEEALNHALIAKEINPNHKAPQELLNIINSIIN